MRPVFVIYIAIALLGVFNYFFNLYRLDSKKKLIGKIHSKWSSKFNLTFPINWVNWIAVIAYLLLSFSLIITEPHRDNDYTLLVLFIIFLSFYPRWNIIVGSKGIIMEMEIIFWENIIERRIIDKEKYRYLELKWASDSAPFEKKTKRISIPSKLPDILNKNAKGMSSPKSTD